MGFGTSQGRAVAFGNHFSPPVAATSWNKRGLFGEISQACRASAGTKAWREVPGQRRCPYTCTALSRRCPGPRGLEGFLDGLGRRRPPRGARGRAQPRSLCVSEDSSMKARFSLG